MLIRKAYKFRLKTNTDQEKLLRQFAGHSRFVWNYFWSLNRNRLEQGASIMWYREMDFWSKLLKSSEEYGFLKEAPAHILQQKLKDLEKAYKDAFDKQQKNKRMPKKRKRSQHNTFRFPEPKQFKIENRRIFLPKLGWIGFHKSRKIKGTLKNATISLRGGRWYISFQTEEVQKPCSPQTLKPIGIDMGIRRFATTATETDICGYAPKNSFRKAKECLAKEQRKLARKVRYSNNWCKNRQRVQKIHCKIADQRKDYLHKVSHEISKSHAVIFMEDLKVAQMSRCEKGQKQNSERGVQNKSHLNQSILDQGWYEFRRQLTYKVERRGGQVYLIAPEYTSQTCSQCGYRDQGNRRTQDTFSCLCCRHQQNADENAARNILAAGLGRYGLCSESHRGSAAGTCMTA